MRIIREFLPVPIARRLGPLLAVVAALLITAHVTASTGAPARGQAPFPLQVNLDAVAYWTPDLMFKDLVTKSGAWQKIETAPGTCAKVAVDADGYPLDLPGGCRFRLWLAFHIAQPRSGVPPYPTGRYVLLYKGKGAIGLGWDAKGVNRVSDGRIEFTVPMARAGIEIIIASTTPGDHVRDLHVVLLSDEASFREKPFRESYLNLLKPFDIIRPMQTVQAFTYVPADDGKANFADGVARLDANTIQLPPKATATNDHYKDMVLVLGPGSWPRMFVASYDGATRTLRTASPIPDEKFTSATLFEYPRRQWPDRARTTAIAQSGAKGVAYEHVIALANTAKKDLWIVVPPEASDDYVREFAKLLQQTLDPSLKIYVEYSNETWNYSGPGFAYAAAQVALAKNSGASFTVDGWTTKRTIEVFRIFGDVFGEKHLRKDRPGPGRLVRVLTSQTEWTDRARDVMDWTMPGRAFPTDGHKAYEFADVFAVTQYFSVPDEYNSAKLATLSDEQIYERLRSDLLRMTSKKGPLYVLAGYSKDRGMKMIQYEGGQHVTVHDGDKQAIDRFAAFASSPHMKKLYSTSLEEWKKLQDTFGADMIGAWSMYSLVVPPSRFGFWGMVDHVSEDPANSPRYQAIMEFRAR
jgi:hypothetical protein